MAKNKNTSMLSKQEVARMILMMVIGVVILIVTGAAYLVEVI